MKKRCQKNKFFEHFQLLRNRKAQITLFMLIGIVITAGAILTYHAVQVQTKAQLERKANEEKEKLKKEAEKKLLEETKKKEKVEAELKAKEEAEQKAKEEEQQKIENQKKASDRDKLMNLSDIIRPMLEEVKSKKAKEVIGQIYSILAECLLKKEV